MLEFLKLPDRVDSNTTKDELLDRFWAASYMFRFEFVSEEHFKESVITNLVKDIPYEPQSYWDALWFAAMIYFSPKIGFNSLRGQMIQELDRLQTMSEHEIDMLFSLYFHAFEVCNIFCPFQYSLKFVNQLDPNRLYFEISEGCKTKIKDIVQRYISILTPSHKVLCKNPYFGREGMILDVVDQIVSSLDYLRTDLYPMFLRNAMKFTCAWEEPYTEEQLEFMQEINQCVVEAAQERLTFEKTQNNA